MKRGAVGSLTTSLAASIHKVRGDADLGRGGEAAAGHLGLQRLTRGFLYTGAIWWPNVVALHFDPKRSNLTLPAEQT